MHICIYVLCIYVLCVCVCIYIYILWYCYRCCCRYRNRHRYCCTPLAVSPNSLTLQPTSLAVKRKLQAIPKPNPKRNLLAFTIHLNPSELKTPRTPRKNTLKCRGSLSERIMPSFIFTERLLQLNRISIYRMSNAT